MCSATADWTIKAGGLRPRSSLVIGPRRGKLLWQPNARFLALCERGADATADTMYDDLVKICEQARRRRPLRGPLLAEILERNQDLIVDAVDTWAEEVSARRREVRELYEAYCTVAAATGLRVPARVTEQAIVARMTAVMTAYRFYGHDY